MHRWTSTPQRTKSSSTTVHRLVTAANTVIVPVKTGTNSFRVEAHNGTTGKLLWTQNTRYHAPGAQFLPGLGPTLFGNRLFVPDIGGRVLVRNKSRFGHGAGHSFVLLWTEELRGRSAGLRSECDRSTLPSPPTPHGNIFFGFLVLGSTPIGLQSGLARIAPDGRVPGFQRPPSVAIRQSQKSPSAVPPLSRTTAVRFMSQLSMNNDFGFGYLVALNSTTLAVVNHVLLLDPSSGLDATLIDDSSAAPTVGPDGDVYFGVLENPFPSHNDRGWMLHFNSDLSIQKIPGSFGWDDTAFDRRCVAGLQLSRYVEVSADDEIQQLCRRSTPVMAKIASRSSIPMRPRTIR